ncbi:MAG: hypothetical protein R2911_27455 [Caldilineaceae bacterium]
MTDHAPAGPDLLLNDVQLKPPLLVSSSAPSTVTVTAVAQNLGDLAAQNVRLHVWRQDGANAFTLLGTSAPPVATLAAGENAALALSWSSARLSAGQNVLFMELDADNAGLEKVCANHRANRVLTVFEQGVVKQLYLPVAVR